MQVDQWLRTAAMYLQSRGVLTARLDCLVLLEDMLRIPRAKLLAEPTTEISAPQLAELQKLLNRRARHEPLAYLRGHSEFYGREFIVGPGVLVPRPESETIIELLISIPEIQESLSRAATERRQWQIGDVGAGSGALGISAALEVLGSQVELLEIDDAALRIAGLNVAKHTTSVLVTTSDLLAGSLVQHDILLCNLPYVPDAYPVNDAAKHEPAIALYGGNDGLDLYRQMFVQIQSRPTRPLYILTEALPESHDVLAQIALASGYKLIKTDDFVQLYGS